MKLLNKFRLINCVVLLCFLAIMLIFYRTNMSVLKKSDELANTTKKLDFLISLKTELENLQSLLYGYIREPNRSAKDGIEDSIGEFESLLSRSRDFQLDDDEMMMVSYLRKNIKRFNDYLKRVISEGEKTPYFNALRKELFERVSTEINEHWMADMKKLTRVYAEAKSASARIVPIYLSALIILVFTVFVINRVISRRIVKPLQLVAEESSHLAGGELDRRISIRTGDEIETLASNLNRMAEGLKDKIEALEEAVRKEQRVVRELAILNEFMGFISSEVEIETILTRFAERAKDLLKAEYGALYMIEEGSDVRFYSTEPVLKRELVDPIVFKEDSSIEEVFERFQIRRESGLDISLEGGLRISNMIVVPVGSTGDLKCILLLFNKEGDFNEEDEDSIFSFTFQAFQTISLQYELARLATTDGLTGLYNHRMFQERLEEELLRARRYDRKLFLMMIDIDHFKQFNDTYGHQTGDEVLKTVARLIKGNVRNLDFPARYGGEEFVVILPETDCKNALMVGERLRSLVEGYPFFVGDGERARITISIGISCYPNDSDDKTELIRMADEALYHAKKMGRNRVYLYSDIGKV